MSFTCSDVNGRLPVIAFRICPRSQCPCIIPEPESLFERSSKCPTSWAITQPRMIGTSNSALSKTASFSIGVRRGAIAVLTLMKHAAVKGVGRVAGLELGRCAREKLLNFC
jgi:hypothetical protein